MKHWTPGRDAHAVRLPAIPLQPERPDSTPPHVVVVGGGIAGLAAATGLAEHGVRVTLLDSNATLGGRVRSWPLTLPDGSQATMSRGFHAFFRQYYNLRNLLRRADPGLARLRALPDYPLALADGPVDSFRRVPKTPPFNLLGFVATSPTFRVRDLARVNVRAALDLLRVNFPATYTDLDGVSATQLLDRLRFPAQARHLALEVFARSFFADPDEFSGAELLAMFHTYFIGSAEGLIFDVPDDDYDTALWRPLAAYLERLGVDIHLAASVTGLEDTPDGLLAHTTGEQFSADALVLAADVRGLRRLVEGASWLGTPEWRDRITRLRSTPPFGVGRRWLADASSFRDSIEPFLGTSGYGPLDNLSRVDAFEAGAANWARATGGTVVEVHGYALPDDHECHRERLWREATRLHPELDTRSVIAEEWLVRDDCVLVDTSPWHDRPTVETPDPRVVLAGDLVRTDAPVALMERAATTGWQAANQLLARWGRRGETLWSPPMRGLLAGPGGGHKQLFVSPST